MEIAKGEMVCGKKGTKKGNRGVQKNGRRILSKEICDRCQEKKGEVIIPRQENVGGKGSSQGHKGEVVQKTLRVKNCWVEGKAKRELEEDKLAWGLK